jgi:fibronectin-binding autotransporter adhesin
MITKFMMNISHNLANSSLGGVTTMQNKTTLQTPNEILTVNEPWHRGSGFTWMLLALAGLVFFLSGAAAKAQETVYWRGEASNGNWANTEGSNINNWYRSGDGWTIRRGDLAAGQWSPNGTKSYNVIIFNNGTEATTTLNAEGGTTYQIYRLLLQNGTSRTFNASGGSTISLGGGSADAKIETESGATGTYTFNVPLTMTKTTEFNAVNGNMVFSSSSTINTGGYTLESYTASGKQLELNGVISGSGGGVTHGGGGLVILGAANTYTGSTTVNGNGGVLQIKDASALGSTAAGTTVGSGAALEIYGSLGTISEGLTLSGTGSSGGGALRNLSGDTSWAGSLSLNASSRINSDSGTLTLSGGVSVGSNVLFVGGGNHTTVSSAISGAGGSQDGTTTTLFKDGAGNLTLSGNNSYSGDTRITGGTLTVANGGNLGSGSDVYVSDGATLAVNTSTTVASIQETGNNNGGEVAIGSGATLTINGADKGALYQDTISGSGNLVVNGSGTTSLNLYGTQGWTGSTTVSGGKLSSAVALASTSLTVNGGTLETTADGVIANNASTTLSSGTFSIGGNDTIGSVTATGGRLSVGDSKTAYLTNGTSSIGASAEVVGGTLNVTSGSTLVLNSDDAENTSAITIASGGTLNGSGTTTGALLVSGTLAPGNSTGILDVGNTTFLSGGNYDWEIDNFTGVAGTNWDFLDITGSLTISATSTPGSQFIIDVISLLAADDTAGLASNFNSASNYTFAIATASGGISGYNAAAFSINTSGFQNTFTGTWGTSVTGNSLNITYTAATAIPEPSSASMLVLGLAAALAKRRRVARG